VAFVILNMASPFASFHLLDLGNLEGAVAQEILHALQQVVPDLPTVPVHLLVQTPLRSTTHLRS